MCMNDSLKILPARFFKTASGTEPVREWLKDLDAEGSMKAMPENPNRGSSFEDFLKEEGILEASTTTAVKRVLAWQIAEAMRSQHLTKSAMAARMNTSRSQLERLLDPEKTGVSLETIQRAAAVVGRKLRVELV